MLVVHDFDYQNSFEKSGFVWKSEGEKHWRWRRCLFAFSVERNSLEVEWS